MSRSLQRSLQSALDRLPDSVRCLVLAYSGGIDSTALLLHLLPFRERFTLRLWHVHHGLQAEADRMADFARETARRHDLPLRVDHLGLDSKAGNREARAREARYGLFAAELAADEALITAHHASDQAETLLLNLLRGSGPAGLAGIAGQRPLGQGLLLRPWLGHTRHEIEAFVRGRGMEWVEDPSNRLMDADRNFLRHRVFPELEQRWPAAQHSLARAAEWQSEAASMLDDLARQDARRCLVDRPFAETACVDIEALYSLTIPRQKNLLRHWLERETGRPLPLRSLEQLLQQGEAREDGQPCVALAGAEVRRFQRHWYLLLPGWEARVPQPETAQRDALAAEGRQFCYRPQLDGQGHRLKRLFQQHAVPPWLRDRLPLLCEEGRVIDLWRG